MTFNPRDHLIQLKGKDYLEVKWRLVWLTETAHAYSIDTDVVELNERRCVCKARVTVTTEEGVVCSAEGLGSETPNDFPDYIEKAQTKAIGRALAHVGFGTQFAVELEGEAEAGRIVDAAVERRTWTSAPVSEQATYRPPASNGQRPRGQGDPFPPSNAQFGKIRGIARELGIDPIAFARERYKVNTLDDLTGGRQGTASLVIEELERMQRERRQPQAEPEWESVDDAPF